MTKILELLAKTAKQRKMPQSVYPKDTKDGHE